MQIAKINFATRLQKHFITFAAKIKGYNFISTIFMIRLMRNMGNLFLLLAGLVILLHSTIPHHHDSGTHLKTKSSECNSHESSDNGIPAHCQAFNDVVAEKVSSLNFSLQAATCIFVAFPHFKIILTENRAVNAAFISYNIVPPKQYFSTKLSFRGPPLFI